MNHNMPNDVENPNLSWLDAQNDESHKAEIAPLFGTGKVSLLDEDTGISKDSEGRGSEHKGSSVVKYGAIENDDDDEDEDVDEEEEDDTNDEDHHLEPSVVTTGSSSMSSKSKSNKSSPSKAKPNKNNYKQKVKVILTETGKPEMPQRSFLLAVFYFFESFGVIASLCLLVTQLVPIFVVPLSEIGAMSLCLKAYVSLFCILFILVEWDVPIGFLRTAGFLQTYISRGFLYSFVGLSCLEEAYSERVKDMVAHARDQFHVSWYSLFMQVSSWMMAGLGVVYMILGLCCLKRLRDKAVNRHREQWDAYREAMKIYRARNPEE